MRQIDRSNPITYKDKLKNAFRIKKPIYKNWWIYPLSFVVLFFFIFGIPMIINEAYKANNGYFTTIWGAPEVLSYYAVILSGFITITALIITIHFSKSDTQKQLKFYMAQVKAPFFIIEKIYQTNSRQEFTQYDDGTWVKIFNLSKDGKLSREENEKIDIVLENIGDGIALAPYYQVDMFASSIPEHIIKKDTQITLIYDLQRNLDDQWVTYYLGEEIQKKRPGYIEFYSYIKLLYQNMLGVELHQELPITIKVDFENSTLTLIIPELSPQRFKIDN